MRRLVEIVEHDFQRLHYRIAYCQNGRHDDLILTGVSYFQPDSVIDTVRKRYCVLYKADWSPTIMSDITIQASTSGTGVICPWSLQLHLINTVALGKIGCKSDVFVDSWTELRKVFAQFYVVQLEVNGAHTDYSDSCCFLSVSNRRSRSSCLSPVVDSPRSRRCSLSSSTFMSSTSA